MKDIIRMNQLAGIITEGQAKKMMQVLNEEMSWADIDAKMDAERQAKDAANEKYLASRAGRMLASELQNITSKPFEYDEVLELLLDLNPTSAQFLATAEKLGLDPYSEGGGIGLDHENYQDKGAMFNNFGGWGKG